VLYLPLELSAEWLSIAARRCRLAFRPIVLNVPELLMLLAARAEPDITVLGRRNFAAVLLANLRRRLPRAPRSAGLRCLSRTANDSWRTRRFASALRRARVNCNPEIVRYA
jgi:hypothetical protein